MENKAFYEKKASILKALAHPIRLWIVDELENGEKCVCEFVNATNLDFSTISKHLLVLKNAGIISDDKRGKQVFYKLKFCCVSNFSRCLAALLKEQTTEQIKIME
ncbi:MAG: ArsR/SmtB family transcription factor [Alphaproteobacteria bacterium]